MSRIGKAPIKIPANVQVNVAKSKVTVKGPLGQLEQAIHPDITVEIEENVIHVTRPTDHKRHRSMHGLYRSLINNMVIGVSEGYTVQQEFVGVGYKAEAKGQMLEMSVGYSHDVHFLIPGEIQIETKTERRSNPILTMKSHDKQLLGAVAAKIRSLRPPEPYKGKGIKFVGEELRRKAGKSASK